MGMGRDSIRFLTDTGVKKTILNWRDWRSLKEVCELKDTRLRFRPYGTKEQLPIQGRARVTMTAEAGAEIQTYVYVNKSEEESLLGQKDAEALGVVVIKAEGASQAVAVNRVLQNRKADLDRTVKKDEEPEAKVAEEMERICASYKEVFKGIGKYTGEEVKIHIDKTAQPVIQPPCRIPIHYLEPLKEHLQELKESDVIEGPLEQEEPGTWISNLVITGKKWDQEAKGRPDALASGERVQIRGNLDLRPLNKVVYKTNEPIPTPESLRHKLVGSNRFSTMDMTHCFHQFVIEEEARKYFTFRTPWGLYRYKRMVMGNSPASSECQKRVRQVLEGCEGICQIKHDVLVYGDRKEHDRRLQEVLRRFKKAVLTLRKASANLARRRSSGSDNCSLQLE